MRLAICLVVAVAVTITGCRPPQMSTSSQPPTQIVRRTFTRQQIRELVEDKTEAEVLRGIGVPDSTVESDRGHKTFRYDAIAVDTITGKTGPLIVRLNTSGFVVEIDFP